MKHFPIIFFLLLSIAAIAQPKREFRGAWIQCVNGQFQGLPTATIQKTLSYQLDELQKDGVNAIIFQVRPECDALYESKLEPWSRFLTGRQGLAPNPRWDPLAWMIDQCHRRGMELHAWINPYRAKTKTTTELAVSHIAVREPARCFDYDGQKILNPGMPDNSDYICRVVADIVSRYDIDGLHIDDYFYPYPVAGQTIPDDEQYAIYKNGIRDRGDWRRYNVNLFVEQLYHTVHDLKPWVKVGISPFGIYRNKRNWPMGSDTRGLQNYDDLYADVLFWISNGWLDYCVPQLYWEIGHSAADYDALIRWWNKNASARPLFIGEDVERTAKAQQQEAKLGRLHSEMGGVKGTVLWYAKAAVDNIGGYATNLRNNYWRTPALQPLMPFIDGKAPAKVRKPKAIWTADGYMLFWLAPKGKTWKDKAEKYVVYRFAKGEKADLSDPRSIETITSNCYYKLPYNNGKEKFTYVITALDRMSNESKGVKVKVKL